MPARVVPNPFTDFSAYETFRARSKKKAAGRYVKGSGWRREPKKPEMQALTQSTTGNLYEIPKSQYDEFMRFVRNVADEEMSEPYKSGDGRLKSVNTPADYVDYVFGKNTKTRPLSVQGAGHILQLDYAPRYQVLRVYFLNRKSICCFFQVPRDVFGELSYLAESGATRGDGRHLLGVRFWDLVRVRGTVHQTQFKFIYTAGGATGDRPGRRYGSGRRLYPDKAADNALLQEKLQNFESEYDEKGFVPDTEYSVKLGRYSDTAELSSKGTGGLAGFTPEETQLLLDISMNLTLNKDYIYTETMRRIMQNKGLLPGQAVPRIRDNSEIKDLKEEAIAQQQAANEQRVKQSRKLASLDERLGKWMDRAISREDVSKLSEIGERLDAAQAAKKAIMGELPGIREAIGSAEKNSAEWREATLNGIRAKSSISAADKEIEQAEKEYNRMYSKVYPAGRKESDSDRIGKILDAYDTEADRIRNRLSEGSRRTLDYLTNRSRDAAQQQRKYIATRSIESRAYGPDKISAVAKLVLGAGNYEDFVQRMPNVTEQFDYLKRNHFIPNNAYFRSE